MNSAKGPLIRVFIGLVIIAAFFSISLREFLKVTFMFGIPFIFLLGFLIKKRRYSLLWIVSLLLLLVVLTGYGYTLTTLPKRIEVKNILHSGTSYEAKGQYGEAIEEYKKLESLGEDKKMKELIIAAESELEGQKKIEEARKHINNGEIESAKALLDNISPNTRAFKEAKQLKKSLEE